MLIVKPERLGFPSKLHFWPWNIPCDPKELFRGRLMPFRRPPFGPSLYKYDLIPKIQRICDDN